MGRKEAGRCGVENQRGRKRSMEVSGRVRIPEKKNQAGWERHEKTNIEEK